MELEGNFAPQSPRQPGKRSLKTIMGFVVVRRWHYRDSLVGGWNMIYCPSYLGWDSPWHRNQISIVGRIIIGRYMGSGDRIYIYIYNIYLFIYIYIYIYICLYIYIYYICIFIYNAIVKLWISGTAVARNTNYRSVHHNLTLYLLSVKKTLLLYKWK